MSSSLDHPVGENKAKTNVTRLVRPTLFIALGGTGKEIVLRLRRRILQNDWGGLRISDLSNFPVASFLYFDTDTTEAVESDRSRSKDILANAVAFGSAEKLQRRVDTLRYLTEIDNFPHIKQWLPQGDLSKIDTSKGAGQVRAISRLLFFDEFASFRNLVSARASTVLNNVSRQDDLKRLNIDPEKQLRVVIVCSSAGGTGSGSFIDAGLAIRSMKDPHPAQVDLVLVMPGGFKNANSSRVNANAFAALMELEQTMRPNAQPRYVTRWTETASPDPNIIPFDDVYLVDTRNVVGEATERVDDLYDMVADTLFEDFGNSEFAARKRSVAPNQAQHKLGAYRPPLPSNSGHASLGYSIAYSSFGQATIETKSQIALDVAAAESCREMIKTFFNVAGSDSGRLPTPAEIQDFLFENFDLATSVYEAELTGLPENVIVNEPKLIDELLRLPDGETVYANLTRIIQGHFDNQILNTNDVGNWVTLATSIFEDARIQVVGGMEHAEVGPAAALIVRNRMELARRLKGGGDDGIRAVLFKFLDNKVRGGLDYTIQLVEEAKNQMAKIQEELEHIVADYEEHDRRVREVWEHSIQNLQEASQNRSFGRGPDRAAAQRFVEHLRMETGFYVTLLLRGCACREAQALLAEMSADLGRPRGVNAAGETEWDGAISVLIAGRETVKNAMQNFDDEITLLRHAVSRANAGTYIVLPDLDGDTEAVMQRAPGEIERWADEMFKDEGGSRALFPKLDNEKDRNVLFAKLRGFAMAKLKPRAEKLRTAHQILAAMDPPERRRLFRDALNRAMPWINADFGRLDRNNMPMADRYKLFIAVGNKEKFQRDFGEEIKQAVPSDRLGFTAYEVVASALDHRIIVYCELSGIPLDCIVPLRAAWREAYVMEKRKAELPVHNHRSSTRFANPVVPTTEELKHAYEMMSLFIRGVAFGILHRREGEDAVYEMDLSEQQDGDWASVGTERDIRSAGFAASHEENIHGKLGRFIDRLTPVQLVAAYALMDWTARRAYAPKMGKIGENQEQRVPGLASLVASDLAKSFLNRVRTVSGGDALKNPQDAGRVLRDNVEQWTIEVPNSLNDVDAMEVNLSPSDPESLRATDKRQIRPEQFTEEALLAILRSHLGAEVSLPPVSPTPIKQARSDAPTPIPTTGARPVTNWRISVKKQVSGPFDIGQMAQLALDGKIGESTNILADNAKQWTKVRDWPELTALFNIPDDDEDIPPPPDD